MKDRGETKNSSSKQSRKAPPGICANVNDDLLSLQKVSLFICLSAGAVTASVCVCVLCVRGLALFCFHYFAMVLGVNPEGGILFVLLVSLFCQILMRF